MGNKRKKEKWKRFCFIFCCDVENVVDNRYKQSMASLPCIASGLPIVKSNTSPDLEWTWNRRANLKKKRTLRFCSGSSVQQKYRSYMYQRGRDVTCGFLHPLPLTFPPPHCLGFWVPLVFFHSSAYWVFCDLLRYSKWTRGIHDQAAWNGKRSTAGAFEGRARDPKRKARDKWLSVGAMWKMQARY